MHSILKIIIKKRHLDNLRHLFFKLSYKRNLERRFEKKFNRYFSSKFYQGCLKKIFTNWEDYYSFEEIQHTIKIFFL